MSHVNNTRFLEDAQVDFSLFISQKKLADAEALLDNLWDLGFKRESILLQKQLVIAKMTTHPSEIDSRQFEPKELHEREEEAAMDRDDHISSAADIW